MAGYTANTEDVSLAESGPHKVSSSSSAAKVCGPFTKLHIIIMVCVVVGAGVIVGIVVGVTQGGGDVEDGGGGGEEPGPEHLPPEQRIDCYPEEHWAVPPLTVTKEMCEKRGCTYDVDAADDVSVAYPSCYVGPDSDMGAGYRVVGEIEETPYGFKVLLEPNQRLLYVGEQLNITMDVQYRTNTALRIKFYDGAHARYEVPDAITRIRLPNDPTDDEERQQFRYRINITNNDPFSFSIIRTATGTVLWDTSVGGLVFADRYLSLSTRLPSTNMYGMGENTHRSFRHDMNYRTWGMFARDNWVDYNGNNNHYGVHPFYTCLEKDGKSHGVLLLNSNAMDYSVTPLPMLTYRSIGGVLDFYMFLGPTPENVVQQYTGAVGRPYFPPYWSLGFQLCRYGYNHIDLMKAAVSRTIDNDIPLDVQYADIDHYDERKVFTIDHENFSGLKEYFQELRDGGMHTIIILDPCLVSNASDYAPYAAGFEKDVYIKWPDKDIMPEEDYKLANNTLNMLGYVWPKGRVVFPDYFKNVTEELWAELIVKHINEIDFDGLWIDMNEPANFGTNEEKPWNWPDKDTPYWSLHCPKTGLDNPPYKTMAVYAHGSDKYLADKTLCMSAVQGENGTYNHYDVHSLYGASQISSTLQGLREATEKRDGRKKRGLVLSRSTFPGSGEKAGHWLGDNFAEWPMLHHSIVGMLEFNLFGIPYIGADICGFFGNTTVSLCKRWMQLGAFYPFSRNHNDANSRLEQDPGNLGDDVISMSRASLITRYELLPYLYTCFYHAHTRGSTVVRPLMHEFPQDSSTWDIDSQFLWGGHVLISPILQEDQTQLQYYLPKARWYNYYDGRVQVSEGSIFSMEVYEDTKIPVHIRGGTVLAIQDSANNTVYSRQNPFHVRVYLDAGGNAGGELYWDDGDSLEPIAKGDFFLVKYTASDHGSRVWSSIQHNNSSAVTGLRYESVRIHGVMDRPAVVLVNQQEHGAFTYHKDAQILDITSLFRPLGEEFMIEWRLTRVASEAELERVDCQPGGGANREACLASNCLWDTSAPKPVPHCYINKTNYGYLLESTTDDYHILQRPPGHGTMFGGDIERIKVTIDQLDNDVLHLKFLDDSNDRYEVPVHIDRSPAGSTEMMYSISVLMVGQSYDLTVQHKASGLNVLDLSLGGLTYTDQFLQLVTRLPSSHVYGLGENRHPSFRHDVSQHRTWPMFSRDQPPGWGDGNLYGVHPYYMCVENDEGHSHGMLFLNSNAMEVSLSSLPSLTYRSTGGILDLYIVFADTPEGVTQRYSKLIGLPYLPAYWSLGFQLCRYGYNNIDNLQAAVNRTIAANIPFDVQYTDIDSFEENKDFTWDKDRFPGLPDYIMHLQSIGMRMVLILDPAILSTDPDYEVYTSGKEEDVYIQWPAGYQHPDIARFENHDLHGYVWPNGPAVFPDFMKNSTKEWWSKHIVDYHQKHIPFDGLWIDMNEPANFGTNEEKPWNWPEDNEDVWSLKCIVGDPLEDPPYKPASMLGERLSDKTLCMVGESTDGSMNYTQYDIHSLYGWSQTQPTLRALQLATGERGILISRSTYPSSGRWSGHWLGDNDSAWSHLHESIIGMLEFGLFGIPYIGADICGYFGDTTAEMCQRWMQLGAFYTFSRNHNGLNNIDQDPGALGDEVADASRVVLEIRYTLLPYLYTLFYTAHTEGSTVIRALMAEFSSDPLALGIDRQFMWGGGLLISPVLDEGRTTVDAYFPTGSNDRWYSYYDGSEVALDYGHYVTLDAPLDMIPLHVRGGFILPTQQHANTTHYSREKPFGLLVAPDKQGHATGMLFWDDGVSIDSVETGEYNLYNFTFQTTGSDRSLMMSSMSAGFVAELPYLQSIQVFGEEARVRGDVMVTVDGEVKVLMPEYVMYKTSTKVLRLRLPLGLPMNGNSSWTLSWRQHS